MIDLHLHTTASDGRSTPEELVERAAARGLRVLSVTDHDTMAATAPVAAAAGAAGVLSVPGIEITAVENGRDLHVLGYFLERTDPDLCRLLQDLRAERDARAREIGHRLASLGAPIDVDALLAVSAAQGGSVARPQLAQALVAAGHVQNIAEAFDRFLGESCGAYVPHRGYPAARCVDVIRRAGGVPSFAHPGTAGRDDLIPALLDAGLAALEAYHSAHDAAQQAHYLALADRYGLAVTGGSDYHGEGVRRAEFLGAITLPPDAFQRLCDLAQSARLPAYR